MMLRVGREQDEDEFDEEEEMTNKMIAVIPIWIFLVIMSTHNISLIRENYRTDMCKLRICWLPRGEC